MKPFFYIASLLFLFVQQSFAQSPGWLWAEEISDCANLYGQSIARDPSGNIYITGYFYGNVDFNPGPAFNYLTSTTGSYDIFILKTDSSGNFIWAKKIGGIGEDRGNAITCDNTGNVYITGAFEGIVDFNPGADSFLLGPSSEIYIAKLSGAGNFIWAKDIGTTTLSYGQGIVTDESCNVYSTGLFAGTGDFDPGAPIYNLSSPGLKGGYISKLDSAGNFIFAKGFIGTDDIEGRDITLDASGNIYTTGDCSGIGDFDPAPLDTFLLTTFTTNSNVFISKLDASGNFVWAKRFGGNSHGWSIVVDASENVYSTGHFQFNNADFDPGPGIYYLNSGGYSDAFISKLNSQGNFAWAKAIGDTGEQKSFCIRLDKEGNVYTAGYYQRTVDFDPDTGIYNIQSVNNEADGYVLKYDSAANFIWAKSIGGWAYEQSNQMVLNDAGDAYVMGWFTSDTIYFDTCLVDDPSSIGGAFDVFLGKLSSQIATDKITPLNSKKTEMNLFPNPCINCEITGVLNPNDLNVTDMLGRIVNAGFSKSANGFFIRLPQSANGIFFIQNAKTGEVVKFVKE